MMGLTTLMVLAHRVNIASAKQANTIPFNNLNPGDYTVIVNNPRRVVTEYSELTRK